ncbi:transposase, partial [Streptococcus suis]
MEQLNLITNLLRIKDKNIVITDEYDMGTHLELHGHLDYTAPKCPSCKGQMAKYDFQKASKIPYLETAPEVMSWDEYGFKKGKMSFIAQDFDSLKVISILDGRTQATIRNHFLRYSRQARNRVKVITMDMFSPYYQLAKQLFPHAKIVLDRFHIVQHLSRAMNRVRIQIMNQLDRKSQEYRALKRYWKLIQQDSRKLSDKRFY